MTQWLLNSKGVWENGLAIVRVIVGVFLIYHGTQAFRPEEMKDYVPWLADLHVPMPDIMPYVGKATELLGGLCLVLGLFTRVATVMLILNFTFISFVMGHGKIFTDSQHAFMFALMGWVFLFMGPGRWSLDHRLFNKENKV